MQQSPYW